MCAIQMIFLGAWLIRQLDAAPWLIFFYFTTLLGFESLNIIRQATSLMIVLFALSCLARGSVLRYCIWIALASTLHVSALMMLPLAFVIGREWNKYRLLSFGMLFFSYLASNELKDILFDVLPLFSLLNTGYSSLQSELFFEADASVMSFGLILAFLVDALVIYFYPQLIKRYRDNGFVLYFNLFYVGALLSPVVYFSNYIAFTRLAFYFTSFRFVMLGFLLAYLLSRSGRSNIAKLLATALIMAYLGMFCVAIIRGAAWCSPFQFVFE
jgi:transmembrane protein EpsG